MLTFIQKDKYAYVTLPLVSKAICDFTPDLEQDILYFDKKWLVLAKIFLTQITIILNHI